MQPPHGQRPSQAHRARGLGVDPVLEPYAAVHRHQVEPMGAVEPDRPIERERHGLPRDVRLDRVAYRAVATPRADPQPLIQHHRGPAPRPELVVFAGQAVQPFSRFDRVERDGASVAVVDSHGPCLRLLEKDL